MNRFFTILLHAFACIMALNSVAQKAAWVADNGDGTYNNPVIHEDYSDPDAIRVGDDYYMIASSFNHMPGLPILHSKDLVNWSLIGHALKSLAPFDHFSKVQHGCGVWAPAIRYHNNEFWIYYPDPDFGIYLTKAKNITGPWSKPMLVEFGKGLIDPCPLWDDDGKVYLVHAYANSRAGIKSIIVVKELNKEGTDVISDSVRVYDGHINDPTIEGPKFYKRNGYYYIFAPAGGVKTGWQVVLRSRNVYGPYERKIVMDQGSTTINGPHQGAWVDTKTGEDWFLHFQDKDAYGRIVHLQPMKWVNDWPVIGNDTDGDGKGEPVLTNIKPNVGKKSPLTPPVYGDQFNSAKLGLEWQWQAIPDSAWFSFEEKGQLRLYSVKTPDSLVNIWPLPNILGWKFPGESFSAGIKFSITPENENERFGFVVFGLDYAGLVLEKKPDGLYLYHVVCENADKGKPENKTFVKKIGYSAINFKINVLAGGKCYFSYGIGSDPDFEVVGSVFLAKPGKWVGAKVGIFHTGRAETRKGGYADIDWFGIGL